ncbi:MAG: DNA recombination protein RmuC [Candidatus Omnitrophica bacterium]|nr:DNA recombination protein RmuC [Candidatus Omnitrophota bacterium]
MEILILGLLITLTCLVVFAIVKAGRGTQDEKIQSMMNEKFIAFQSSIYNTMENTRREVESSKNIISDHAIKTLDTIKDMGSTIEKIMQQQKEAQDLGNSLKYLLQTPKLRGSYGEEILEELLDKVLQKGIFWERQYSIEGGERVDAVIKYKDVIIPIDAKFPREIYDKYLNAEDDEDKKRSWKAYEDGLKVQINSIKSKYIKPEKGTSDFALMFIPSESIYYETIAEKNFMGQPSEIYEYARTNKVIPVSPNTFYAFLQLMIMGIRNLGIIKSAKKLQEALVRIERNFRLFYNKYEEMGSSIQKAQNAYKTGDAHIKRFKDNIESTIKLELKDQPELEEKIVK